MSNHTTGEMKSQSRILKRVWTKKRQNLKIIRNLEAIGEQKKAEKIRECGTFLRVFTPFEGKKELIETANFCRQRMCMVCAWRRSKRFIATTAPVLEYIHNEAAGKEKYVFLTLTLKNVEDEGLKLAIDNLLVGWSTLTRQKAYKEAVLGAVRSLEVSYNEIDNTYHPHIHALLLMRENYYTDTYLNHDTWCKMWQRASQAPYMPSVDVRAVKDITKDIGVRGAVVETLKYSMKPKDLSISPDVTATIMYNLAGRRLISFTGHIAEIRKLLRMEDYENTLCDAIGQKDGYSILYHFTPSGWEIINSEEK